MASSIPELSDDLIICVFSFLQPSEYRFVLAVNCRWNRLLYASVTLRHIPGVISVYQNHLLPFAHNCHPRVAPLLLEYFAQRFASYQRLLHINSPKSLVVRFIQEQCVYVLLDRGNEFVQELPANAPLLLVGINAIDHLERFLKQGKLSIGRYFQQIFHGAVTVGNTSLCEYLLSLPQREEMIHPHTLTFAALLGHINILKMVASHPMHCKALRGVDLYSPLISAGNDPAFREVLSDPSFSNVLASTSYNPLLILLRTRLTSENYSLLQPILDCQRYCADYACFSHALTQHEYPDLVRKIGTCGVEFILSADDAFALCTECTNQRHADALTFFMQLAHPNPFSRHTVNELFTYIRSPEIAIIIQNHKSFDPDRLDWCTLFQRLLQPRPSLFKKKSQPPRFKAEVFTLLGYLHANFADHFQKYAVRILAGVILDTSEPLFRLMLDCDCFKNPATRLEAFKQFSATKPKVYSVDLLYLLLDHPDIHYPEGFFLSILGIKAFELVERLFRAQRLRSFPPFFLQQLKLIGQSSLLTLIQPS